MAKEESTSLFDCLKQAIKQLLGDRLLLAKMETAEKVSILAARLVFLLAASMVLFFVLLFVSIMGGYYFAQITGSLFIGFAILAGIYLLLLVLLLTVGRKWIFTKIESFIITTIFNDDNSQKKTNNN